MQQSMPETPFVRSLFDYVFWKGLKRDLPASEYKDFVRWWNSQLSTGVPGSRRSNENSSG